MTTESLSLWIGRPVNLLLQQTHSPPAHLAQAGGRPQLLWGRSVYPHTLQQRLSCGAPPGGPPQAGPDQDLGFQRHRLPNRRVERPPAGALDVLCCKCREGRRRRSLASGRTVCPSGRIICRQAHQNPVQVPWRWLAAAYHSLSVNCYLTPHKGIATPAQPRSTSYCAEVHSCKAGKWRAHICLTLMEIMSRAT